GGGREVVRGEGCGARTVTKIARLAGVSLQTLYLACGSKRELLQVVLSEALSGTPSGIGGPLPAGAQLLKAQGGACREGRSSPAAHGFGGRGAHRVKWVSRWSLPRSGSDWLRWAMLR